MSGHSKWSQIKHKKELTDKKRGQIFSKLAKMITVAAKEGIGPETNSKLKSAIEKAKEFNLPNENIERAIKRAGEKDKTQIETVLLESIGPLNVVILIEAVTDNKNRTISEIRAILSENNFKTVPSGSLLWQFERKKNIMNDSTEIELVPKTPIKIEDNGLKIKLNSLFEKLDEHDDVEEIYSNVII